MAATCDFWRGRLRSKHVVIAKVVYPCGLSPSVGNRHTHTFFHGLCLMSSSCKTGARRRMTHTSSLQLFRRFPTSDSFFSATTSCILMKAKKCATIESKQLVLVFNWFITAQCPIACRAVINRSRTRTHVWFHSLRSRWSVGTFKVVYQCWGRKPETTILNNGQNWFDDKAVRSFPLQVCTIIQCHKDMKMSIDIDEERTEKALRLGQTDDKNLKQKKVWSGKKQHNLSKIKRAQNTVTYPQSVQFRKFVEVQV